LIVDDSDPWRSVVAAILRHSDNFQIVGEARDGPEAVQKTSELQPDIILLSVGMSPIRGFEAARQIRKLAPHARIVFLAEFASPEALAIAVMMGASCYVLKTDAAIELVPAVEAASQGKRFLSRAMS
jgi:DNA-binding NarL/FixJ family response regulator